MNTPAVSVQLYSCRDHLSDLDGTLGKLAEIGLRHVEGFNFVEDPASLAAALARHGMSAPTGHAPLASEEIRFGEHVFPVPPNEVVFDAAAVAGIGWVIDPMTSLDLWQDPVGVDHVAARLNAAARVARERSLRVGYHNHGHELENSFDGQTALEYLAERLDDDVLLEVDVYWAAVGGVRNVPALLRRLGDRVHALHVKSGVGLGTGDMPLGELVQQPQLPVGQGDLPVAEIIEACPSAEYVVIEFDTFEGDVFEGIAQSYAYLKGLGLR